MAVFRNPNGGLGLGKIYNRSSGRHLAFLLACQFLLFQILFLTGCSRRYDFWQAAENGENLEIPETLGESGTISYTVEKSLPNILVDQVGYCPEGRKLAVFCTDRMIGEREFRVVESDTERIVFTGKIEEKGMDEQNGKYISYGTFTELVTEGRYYVEADGLGRSCQFTIGQDVYGDVFREMYDVLEAGVETNDIRQNCFVLANLLTAYELYPEVCTYELLKDDEEETPSVLSFARVQMEKLLASQDAKSGAVARNAGKSALFAGAAAQLARLYLVYDAAFAVRCKKAAERAWTYAQKEEAGQEELYYASAQLFRLTGKEVYHKSIKAYLGREDGTSSGTERPSFEIYGDVTYLMTEGRVDVALCRTMMDEKMDEVEKIAEKSHRNLYQTASEQTAGDTEQLLGEMVKLAVIDYVITNHEYATVMENHLHFFLGRNPEASSYLAGLGEYSEIGREQDILKNPEQSAQLFFMMSAVINHKTDREKQQ